MRRSRLCAALLVALTSLWTLVTGDFVVQASAQERDCREARVARGDLPDFCRRKCPGHPECRDLLAGQSGDCRIARVPRADLPEFCRRKCPGHPECQKIVPQQSGDCRKARVARGDLPEFCRRCRGHPECQKSVPQQSSRCAIQCDESRKRCMAGVAAEGEKRFRSEKARQDALRQYTNDCRVAHDMCRQGCR